MDMDLSSSEQISDRPTIFQHASPQLQNFNVTSFRDVVNLTLDSNFALFLLSLVCAIFWVVYIVFYNSRVVALLVTKIANHFFVKYGHIHFGKFHL